MDLRELVDAVSKGFTSLGGGPQGLPQRLWRDTNGFAARLLVNVSQLWLPFYAEGHRCGVVPLSGGVPAPCAGTAMLACGACGRPACLDHAQVDEYGGGTCLHCVSDLIAQKRGGAPRPPPGRGQGVPPNFDEERLKAALKTLGLKPGASYDEAARAHRKLAAQHHPDRAKTAAARAKNEQKSKLVNEAFAEIKRQHERRKAAA